MRKLVLTALSVVLLLMLAACAQWMAGGAAGPAYNSGDKAGDSGGGAM